jgi:hypothetical protein
MKPIRVDALIAEHDNSSRAVLFEILYKTHFAEEVTMRNKAGIDMIRRRTILGGLAAVAGIPFFKTLISSPAHAAELPHLSEDDTMAKALHYHQDASTAPRTDKGGTAAADQFCHNCRFVQSEAGTWRPCQIFPGKAVNENGWCTSWMNKT